MCLCASVVSHLWVWLQTGRLAVNDKTTFQSTYWIYTDVKNRDEQGELWAAVFKYQHPCIRMCNTNENFIGGNVFHPKWESIGCGRSHLKSQHLWGWCRITTIIPPPPLCTTPCKKKKKNCGSKWSFGNKCQSWNIIQELWAHDSHSPWNILVVTLTSSNPVPRCHALPYCVSGTHYRHSLNVFWVTLL